MTTNLSRILLAPLGFALLAAIPVSSIPTGAIAGDVDFYCWDLDDGGLECDEIDDLKAECKFTDPDNESDVCKDVAQLARKPLGFTGNGNHGTAPVGPLILLNR